MAEQLVVKSKDIFYRGVTLTELRKMDTREFAKLVTARARRSILRNYDVIEQFVEKCERATKRGKLIKTHDRSLVIVPAMVGVSIGIHNGKDFIRVDIVSEMLGHRLGEFAPTRKIAKHTSVGKKQLKK